MRTIPRLVCVGLLLLGFVGVTWAQSEDLFEFKKVTEGVYAAIAKPLSMRTLNCNAAVIINEDDVIVVDTHSKPSAARALIRGIARITKKPVRYVVNSHFHWDHMQGNEAYPSAFPRGVEIVASTQTRNNIQKLGIPRVKDQMQALPGAIEKLKADLQAANDPAPKKALAAELAQAEAYLKELKTMQLVLPTVTFDKSLVIHRKERDIYLLYLGRGHTDGDVVVYIPKDKVVATGDLLHGWMPYMGDSFPREWVETLKEVEKLDFTKIIGGHGEVGDRGRAVTFRSYLADLIRTVEQEARAGKSLEDVKKSVPDKLAPQHEGQMPGFRTSINANIDKVYSEVRK